MSAQRQHIDNTMSTVDTVLTHSVNVFCHLLTFYNGSDHSFEFVPYLEFAFDYILYDHRLI